MATPPELRAHRDGVDALHFGPLEHVGVWDFVLPPNTEQGFKTSHMEGIELIEMPGVHCPCLTGIKQGWYDNCSVYFELGVEAQSSALPDLNL